MRNKENNDHHDDTVEAADLKLLNIPLCLPNCCEIGYEDLMATDHQFVKSTDDDSKLHLPQNNRLIAQNGRKYLCHG